MKKILCGILVIMLAFSIFAACGETETQTTTTTTQLNTTTTTKPTTTTTTAEIYRPIVWRRETRTVDDNGSFKPYQYDENAAVWLTFSMTDYEPEREAVKEWLKDELDQIKDAMGESYYEPEIFIAKYDMDNNKTEDFLVWICHGGYTGTAGSPLSVMYFDGAKVIGEEYIAHFRLDNDTLGNEGNKQVGIFPVYFDFDGAPKCYNDICVLGDMWVCCFV